MKNHIEKGRTATPQNKLQHLVWVKNVVIVKNQARHISKHLYQKPGCVPSHPTMCCVKHYKTKSDPFLQLQVYSPETRTSTKKCAASFISCQICQSNEGGQHH